MGVKGEKRWEIIGILYMIQWLITILFHHKTKTQPYILKADKNTLHINNTGDQSKDMWTASLISQNCYVYKISFNCIKYKCTVYMTKENSTVWNKSKNKKPGKYTMQLVFRLGNFDEEANGHTFINHAH